jgi:hypothetical protein
VHVYANKSYVSTQLGLQSAKVRAHLTCADGRAMHRQRAVKLLQGFASTCEKRFVIGSYVYLSAGKKKICIAALDSCVSGVVRPQLCGAGATSNNSDTPLCARPRAALSKTKGRVSTPTSRAVTASECAR